MPMKTEIRKGWWTGRWRGSDPPRSGRPQASIWAHTDKQMHSITHCWQNKKTMKTCPPHWGLLHLCPPKGNMLRLLISASPPPFHVHHWLCKVGQLKRRSELALILLSLASALIFNNFTQWNNWRAYFDTQSTILYLFYLLNIFTLHNYVPEGSWENLCKCPFQGIWGVLWRMNYLHFSDQILLVLFGHSFCNFLSLPLPLTDQNKWTGRGRF